MKEIKINDDQARELANAIVLLAAEDYRKGYKEFIEGSKLVNDTKRFFGSGWAGMLTGGVSVKEIFRRLTQEVEEHEQDKNEFTEVLETMLKQFDKSVNSRVRVFTEDGVLYILNVREKDQKKAQERATEFLAEKLAEQMRRNVAKRQQAQQAKPKPPKKLKRKRSPWLPKQEGE